VRSQGASVDHLAGPGVEQQSRAVEPPGLEEQPGKAGDVEQFAALGGLGDGGERLRSEIARLAP
jgi:hypothetical protein